MKFSITFKYSNVTFKNKETKETITYDTKASEGNSFVFDNVDEDVVIGIVKGIKDKKASAVFSYDNFRTNFINTLARNKCKELYDKLDKGEWKVEDVAISNITIKDVEFTKPTMNAREAITVESKLNQTACIKDSDDLHNLEKVVSKAIKDIDQTGFIAKDEKVRKRLHNIRMNLITALPEKKLIRDKYATMESRKMMNESVEPVIFKKDKKDGEVIAFFPETMFDGSVNRGNIMCYAHIGQSSEASIQYFQECKPCKDEAEYADLLAELEDYFNQDPDEEPITLKVVRKPNYGRGSTRRDMWPSRF